MRSVLLLGLAACLACSSSSSHGAAPSGGDGGTGDDSSTANSFTCGKGTVTGTLRATDPNGLGPVAGVTLKAPGCTTAVSDARGYVNVATDPSFVINLDITAGGSMHEYVSLQAKKTGFAGEGYVYESNITSKLPGWSTAQGYLFVLAAGSGSPDAGSCAKGDGVTFSIKGHPEIKATYWSDPLTPDTMLPSTGSLGIATLGPVPPGTYEVDGTKAGCTLAPVDNANFAFESTVVFSAGVLSIQELMVR